MNLLLFGAPGAGKGTQSALLSKNMGLIHISTGDMFRAEGKAGTELGTKVKAVLDAGNLVPDSLTVELIESVIRKVAGSGFILDGFPRTQAQAIALDDLLKAMGKRLDAVVFLSVPSAELVKRLAGRRVCSGCGKVFNIHFSPSAKGERCDNCGSNLVQRSDDKEDVIKNRLLRYEESTAVLKEFYKKAGVFKEVDGTLAEDKVYQAIVHSLKK